MCFVKIKILTPAGEENLDGHILQQITTWKYRPDFGEIPFSMQMIAVFEDLEQHIKNLQIIIELAKFDHSYMVDKTFLILFKKCTRRD